MKLKGIIFEDMINYKKISMVLEFPYCNFKCDREFGCSVCQNSQLSKEPDIDIPTWEVICRYMSDFITSAVVMQGLEPFDSWEDVLEFISMLRDAYNCDDDVVIYTGYNKDEVADYIRELQKFENVIIKFGRYIPGQEPHMDDVLGVNLASDNQYAERIS